MTELFYVQNIARKLQNVFAGKYGTVIAKSDFSFQLANVDSGCLFIQMD